MKSLLLRTSVARYFLIGGYLKSRATEGYSAQTGFGPFRTP
jgi:hypothetical protein